MSSQTPVLISIVGICVAIAGVTLLLVGNAVPAVICLVGAAILLILGVRGLYRNRH